MELTCKTCGAQVSGPDEKSVKETMARHQKKHPVRKSHGTRNKGS